MRSHSMSLKCGEFPLHYCLLHDSRLGMTNFGLTTGSILGARLCLRFEVRLNLARLSPGSARFGPGFGDRIGAHCPNRNPGLASAWFYLARRSDRHSSGLGSARTRLETRDLARLCSRAGLDISTRGSSRYSTEAQFVAQDSARLC